MLRDPMAGTLERSWAAVDSVGDGRPVIRCSWAVIPPTVWVLRIPIAGRMTDSLPASHRNNPLRRAGKERRRIKEMSWKGEQESMRWRVQRMRCWFRAMLAHFDDLLAAALTDVILHGSGLTACRARENGVQGRRVTARGWGFGIRGSGRKIL